MAVLVTGGTGFIGSHVVKNLLQKKKEVIVLTRDIKKKELSPFSEQINWIEGSLSDLSIISKIDSSKLESVIHLAWDGLPNYKESYHIEKNLFENYFFCKNLIESGLKNLTIVGTCFEYGMVDGCLREDMHPIPNNAYAIAKDSLRKFIELFSKKNNFSFKWIRLFYMYGEGQAKNSLIPQLEEAIKSGQPIFNMSGGEQLRDYLPVTEIAENIVLSSLQSNVTGIINCCSGKPISVRNLVENYIKEKKANIKLNLGYYPYPDYEPFAFWGDRSKLQSIIDASRS